MNEEKRMNALIEPIHKTVRKAEVISTEDAERIRILLLCHKLAKETIEKWRREEGEEK